MNYKLFLFSAVSIFFTFNIYSQVNLIQWQKIYGGDKSEYPRSLIPTKDGGALLAKSSNSDRTGNKSMDSYGKADFWVVKIDSNGQIVWQRTYGGDNTENLYTGISIIGGGFLLAGNTRSGKSGNKTDTFYGGYNDAWVVKTDSNGIVEWDKTIGGNGSESIFSMKETPDGTYLLGGSSTSDSSGNKREDSRGGSDFWLIELDATGNILWQRTVGGNSFDMLRS